MRREVPADDLFSILSHAEVDGQRMSDDEIVFETLLILIGGDETTRHTCPVVSSNYYATAISGTGLRTRHWCRLPSKRCCAGPRR